MRPGRPLAQAPLDHPLERFNKEIGRRTDVGGMFPADAALIRPAGMLFIEPTHELDQLQAA